MAKSVLKHPDIVRLGELIKANCVRQADGTAAYKDGWDDERIVKEMEGKANITNVIHLRKGLIGDIVKPTKPGSITDIMARLEALETWAAARPVQGFRRK